MSEKKTQFLIWIPKDLARQVRIRAVTNEETHSAVVERAIRRELEEGECR